MKSIVAFILVPLSTMDPASKFTSMSTTQKGYYEYTGCPDLN